MASSGPEASNDFAPPPPHLPPSTDSKHMIPQSIPNETPRAPHEPLHQSYNRDIGMDGSPITNQAYQQPPPHTYPSNAPYHSSSHGIQPTDIRPSPAQPRDSIHGPPSVNGLSDDMGRDPETPGRAGATPSLSLVFKVPPGSGGTPKMEPGDKAGSENGSGKRKRRSNGPINPSRASRARLSSPHFSGTPASSHSHEPSPIPPGGALSIFAPPPPSALPEALQEVLGSSSSSRHADGADTPGDSNATIERDKEGDALMREADQGFNLRLRSKKSKEDVIVKTGVSASGKGVKVSGAVKEAGRTRKKGKGRGDVDVPNQDFCSACRGIGKFLCCDGCPRSFHFMCLEPPFRVDELPQEETWYCKKCRAERTRETQSPMRDREAKPIPMVFRQLVKRIDEENPVQFRLPQDVRQFFSGVGTDNRGNYVDTEEARTKHDHLSRKGFPDERDGNKLRDGRSRHVACYACGGTSMPNKSTATDPGVAWRQIVSCDYCALHWHLDCLSPPLPSMPPRGLKWMCPNHVDQVLTRRRTVRNNLETIDVESQGLPNNGNIMIIPDERGRETLEYEDMIINKKKYRVPEKIIRLDFWSKLALMKGGKAPGKRRGSESSELTSLASSPVVDLENATEADLTAANLILSFSHPQVISTPQLGSTEAVTTMNGIATPLTAPQDPHGVDTPRRLVLKFNQPK